MATRASTRAPKRTFAKTAKTAEQLSSGYTKKFDTRGMSPTGFFKHLRDDHGLEHGLRNGAMIYCSEDAIAAAHECKRLCNNPSRSSSSAVQGVHEVDPELIANKRKSLAERVALLRQDNTLLEPKAIGAKYGRTPREQSVGSSLVIKLTRHGLKPNINLGRNFFYKEVDVKNALELLEDHESRPRKHLTPNK